MDKNDNNYKIQPDYYGAGTKVDLLSIYEDGLLDGLNQFEAFCIGNTIKYLVRYKTKHGSNDIEKSIEYLRRTLNQKEREHMKVIKDFDSEDYGDKLNYFDNWYENTNGHEDKVMNIINLIILFTMNHDFDCLEKAKKKAEELKGEVQDEEG